MSEKPKTGRLQELMDRLERLWRPDAWLTGEVGPADPESIEQRIRQAIAKGEQVVEVSVVVSLNIPLGDFVNKDPESAIEGLVPQATPQLLAGIVRELVASHQNLVEQINHYNKLGGELYNMWTFSGEEEEEAVPTTSYDFDRGIALIAEREEIELKLLGEKTGVDRQSALPFLRQINDQQTNKEEEATPQEK